MIVTIFVVVYLLGIPASGYYFGRYVRANQHRLPTAHIGVPAASVAVAALAWPLTAAYVAAHVIRLFVADVRGGK